MNVYSIVGSYTQNQTTFIEIKVQGRSELIRLVKAYIYENCVYNSIIEQDILDIINTGTLNIITEDGLFQYSIRKENS